MKTKLTLIAACAVALCGCKGITKSFLGSEGGDSGVISIDSNSVYGKHQLRSMNPKPGYSGFIHPDGTMEMRWVGTNGTPAFPSTQSLPRFQNTPGWIVPLIVDPSAVPAPASPPPR